MRLKCTVSYDGTNYSGWQVQPHANSIQKEIEGALKRITCEDVIIYASGRTDAKVHAIGQVFHFDTNRVISNSKWLQALNSNTPKDIYFRDIEEVSEDFHARYSAIGKIYEYRFSFGEYNVHRQNYCAYLRRNIDIEAMVEASKIFIGTHDFTSFCANPLKDKPNQIRCIESIDIHQEKEEWIITYKGDGFLRYMVRMLSAALIEVGAYRIDKQTLEQWLQAKDKDVCRLNADPCGLYLKEVIY